MVTLELRVDERTLERIRQAAEASQCSVEELVHRILEGNGQQPERGDQLLGMMADEPELMDEVLESAMTTRAQRLQRNTGG